MDRKIFRVTNRQNINTVNPNNNKHGLLHRDQGATTVNEINQPNDIESSYITPPNSRTTNPTDSNKWPLTDPLPKYSELPNPVVPTDMNSTIQSLQYLDPALNINQQQDSNDVQISQQRRDPSGINFLRTNPIHNNMEYAPPDDLDLSGNGKSSQNLTLSGWQHNPPRRRPADAIDAFMLPQQPTRRFSVTKTTNLNQGNNINDVQDALDSLASLNVPGLPTVDTPVVMPVYPPEMVSPTSGSMLSGGNPKFEQTRLQKSPGGDTMTAFYLEEEDHLSSPAPSASPSSGAGSPMSATPGEIVEFLGLPLENSVLEQQSNTVPLVTNNINKNKSTATAGISHIIPTKFQPNAKATAADITSSIPKEPDNFPINIPSDDTPTYMDDWDTLSLYPESQNKTINRQRFSKQEKATDNLYKNKLPNAEPSNYLPLPPYTRVKDLKNDKGLDTVMDTINSNQTQYNVKANIPDGTTTNISSIITEQIPPAERSSYQYIADSVTDDKRKLIGVTKVDQLVLMIQARSKGITEKVETKPNGELLISENSRILPGKNELVGGVEKPRSRMRNTAFSGTLVPLTTADTLLEGSLKDNQSTLKATTVQHIDTSVTPDRGTNKEDSSKGKVKTGKGKKVRSRARARARTYECFYCHRFFSQSTHLDVHLRSHVGYRPYQCQYCGKRFTQGGNLRTHQRLHTGEKPYSCELCNKKFSRKGNLAAHLLTHQNVKPFVCKLDNCNKTFTQLGNMKAHQNRFHLKTLQDLTRRLAQFSASLDEIPERDRSLFEYFASIYKNSNKGIKGRGKGSTRIEPAELASDNASMQSGNSPISYKSNPSDSSRDWSTTYVSPPQKGSASPETSLSGARTTTNIASTDSSGSPLPTNDAQTAGDFGFNIEFPRATSNPNQIKSNIDTRLNPIVLPASAHESGGTDTNQSIPSNLAAVNAQENIMNIDPMAQPDSLKSLEDESYLISDNLDTLINSTDKKMDCGVGVPPPLSDATNNGYSE